MRTKGYDITLTENATGRTAEITINHDKTKWVAKSKIEDGAKTYGYAGYYADLETAVTEAINHIKQKMK